MDSTVSVIEIQRVHEFERKCREYQEARGALERRLRSALETVGRTWRDADYIKVCELADVALQQMALAGYALDEHLKPFLARKLAVMDEKQRS